MSRYQAPSITSIAITSIVAAQPDSATYADCTTAEFPNPTAIVLYDVNVGEPPINLLDYDGDGIDDILSAGAGQGRLLLRRGLGQFRFAPPEHITAFNFIGGFYTDDLRVGDLDLDNIPDLVVVPRRRDGGPRSLLVLRGNADGSFTAVPGAVPYPGAGDITSNSIALAHLDSDPFLDIAYGGRSPNEGLNILTGNGDGTFTLSQAFKQLGRTMEVLAHDLDADGRTDLIALGVTGLATFRNAADGRFDSTAPPINVNDDDAFLAVAEDASRGSTQVIHAVGTFIRIYDVGSDVALGQPVFIDSPEEIRSLATEDLNLDGLDDLVVATGQSTITIRHATPRGFVQTERVHLPNFVTDIDFRDIDNDGDQDVLVAARSWSSTVSVAAIRNIGDGRFTPSSATPFDANAIQGATLADFDNDGINEVVLASRNPGLITINKIQADQSVITKTEIPHENQYRPVPLDIEQAQIDGDPTPDLVLAGHNDNAVTVFLNPDGTGPVQRLDIATSVIPHQISTGDYDDDGDTDVVIVGFDDDAIVFLQNQDGTLVEQPPLQADNAVHAEITDIDHDGIADVIFADYENDRITMIRSNGTGVAHAHTSHIPTQRGPAQFAVEDINADGLLDLVVPHFIDNTAGIYFADTPASFSPPLILDAEESPLNVKTSDFNNDGDIDIAILCHRGGTITVYEQHQSTDAWTRQDQSVGYASTAFLLTDLNQDARPDLLVPGNISAGFLHILHNTCEPAPSRRCPGDTDNDNRIGPDDLFNVLANLGKQPQSLNAAADVAPETAPDGRVDSDDLMLILARFGQSCPP